MQIGVLGIDLGKNSCSLVGLDGQGTVIKRRRMRPASVVGLTQRSAALHHRDGGLLWRASPRPWLMSPEYVRLIWCASKARITCGGRFRPESCRLIWKLTSGLDEQSDGPEPRDKGRLGRLSDPAGCNASEA